MAKNIDRVLRIIDAAAALIQVEAAWNAGKGGRGSPSREARVKGRLRRLHDPPRPRHQVGAQRLFSPVEASLRTRIIGVHETPTPEGAPTQRKKMRGRLARSSRAVEAESIQDR